MVASETSLPTDEPPVLSVAELTARIKELLEAAFPSTWVAGEITDIARPRSGHIYLTLKDADAQIRAVIWRGVAARLPVDLEDGQQVVCRGDIDVYPPRGSYQLVIRQLDLRGEGNLQRALRRLQQKLAAEGLFDASHKRAVPRFPSRVAVVTSPTGAAVRDFLQVACQRWQGAEILIAPSRVQGEGAAAELAAAIEKINRMEPSPDVLVLTRGGGSIEDLWCFNDEAVVRAIFDSRVPVVSAIGHEIDVTLSDLVADLRAATPTEAAQQVVPSVNDVRSALDRLGGHLRSVIQSRAAAARSRLESLGERRVLRRPLDRIRDGERRVDELQQRFVRAIENRVRQTTRDVAAVERRLEALNPLSVLERGYSVTLRDDDGSVVRDAAELDSGQKLTTRFARGCAIVRVESTG